MKNLRTFFLTAVLCVASSGMVSAGEIETGGAPTPPPPPPPSQPATDLAADSQEDEDYQVVLANLIAEILGAIGTLPRL